MTARRLFCLGFLAALLTGFGCSDDDSGGGTTGPVLQCTDTGAAAANTVVTDCAAAIDTVTQQVDVVMGGPASGTTTLGGVNFDVTYDSTRLQLVDPGTYTSPLFPSALVAVTTPSAGSIVVGIQQTGGTTVAVGPGQHVVLSLIFRRQSTATFGPTPLGFENAEATNSSVPVTFTSGVMLSYQ